MRACPGWQIVTVRSTDVSDSLTYLLSAAYRYPCLSNSPDAGMGPDGFWHPLHRGSNLPAVVPASRWDIDRCQSLRHLGVPSLSTCPFNQTGKAAVVRHNRVGS